MAAEAEDGSALATREATKERTSKRSVTDAYPVRFNIPEGDKEPGSPLKEKSVPRGQATASLPLEAPAGHSQDAANAPGRKPTVHLGADGRPLPILKGNRGFGYAQARRLVEQLRVKFAFDRNETRFYCPDTSEHAEPPPAPAELRGAVLGFLKSSKRVIQEAQEIAESADHQAEETKKIEEELTSMTQEYVEKLEKRKAIQKAKANQAIVVSSTRPQRRFLCCGGSPVVP